MRNCKTCDYATGLNQNLEPLFRLALCSDKASAIHCAIHREKFNIKKSRIDCPDWDEFLDDGGIQDENNKERRDIREV